MVYNVKLEVFEGPFDLLCNLIEKSKINIYDIPISEITNQYLEYIRKMQEFNLELDSEFLVLAATLIQIKSKMLLPVYETKESQIEMELEDPRQSLVLKLIEYKKFKNISHKLRELEDKQSKVFFRNDCLYIPKFTVNQACMEIDKLSEIYRNILKRLKAKNKIEIVDKEIYSIKDRIRDILKYVSKNRVTTFTQLLFKSSKREIIVTFLALLELIKQKVIAVEQKGVFSNIVIRVCGGKINGKKQQI